MNYSTLFHFDILNISLLHFVKIPDKKIWRKTNVTIKLYCLQNCVFLHTTVLRTSCTLTLLAYKFQKPIGWAKCSMLCCLVPCKVLTNTFHKTRCILARSCGTDYVLISFSRYWTILHTRYGFIPMASAVCPYKDFSHYFRDNLPDLQNLLVTVCEIFVNDLAQNVSHSTSHRVVSVDSTRQSVKMGSPSVWESKIA